MLELDGESLEIGSWRIRYGSCAVSRIVFSKTSLEAATCAGGRAAAFA